MAGEDVHIAVSNEKCRLGVCPDVLHQGIDASRVGFGGHAFAAAPDDRELALAKVVLHDLSTKLVGLVGKDGRLDALGLQSVQQLCHAGVRGGLVLFVGIIPGAERCQRGCQLFRRAGALRGETFYQFGDAIAHKVLVSFYGKGRPAVLGTDPVGRVGQVVDRVEQGAVQIK